MKRSGAPGHQKSPLLSRIFTLFILVGGEAGFLPAPALSASQEPESRPSAPVPSLKDHAAAMRDALYRRALDFLVRYHQEDLGQAVRLFNQILKPNSDFAPAHGGLAEARSLRYLWGWDPNPERLNEAMIQGKRGVELGPDIADTHLGLGLAMMASELYTPALAEMDRAVELDPDSFRAHLYRGMVLRGLRRTDELAQELTRLLQLDPSSAVAYSLLGDYYQDIHSYSISKESYLTAALLDQRLFWPRLGLGAAYQKQMNFSGASKSYEASNHDFPEESLRCRIMQASVLVATQYYEAALQIYEGIPEKENLSPLLLRRLMQAGRGYSLEKMGNIEKAEYYYTQLVEEFPEDFDGAIRDREVVSQGYEGLVRYYDGKKERKRSTELLEKACRREGMAFQLYRGLADRRRADGDLPGAIAILRKGLRGAPRDLDSLAVTQASLTMIRVLSGGKASSKLLQDAKDLLDEVEALISSAPATTYTPYLDLARCEALLGRDSRALPQLQMAFKKGLSEPKRLAGDPDFKALYRNHDFQELTTSP